jgi:6-phosphogluconolactonase (cycloisomerase 2 family)
VTAFRVDPASGALRVHGQPAALRARPIHISGDTTGTHLLVAYNDPSGMSVHAISGDGTIGVEVPQPDNLDVGIYGHQVRATPAGRSVILVTRGNQPTTTTREDAGAVKVFRYDNGRLANLASIAPSGGIGFRSRHLDFHPTRPWVYLSIESQNRLDMFALVDDITLSREPVFRASTLAKESGVIDGQTTSAIHVHPNGRFVYVANRGARTTTYQGRTVFAGGSNDLAVFRIDPATGEPTLIQNIDTQGFTPRTFAIDPSGRLLVVGNQVTRLVRDGGGVKTVPANVSLFRIGGDGRLAFLRRYDVGVGDKPLWWAGLVPLR